MNKIFILGTISLLLTACSSTTAQLQFDDPAIPNKASLSVPFTVQAPFANWDDPYQEACEEAALLTVHAYIAGEELTPESADEQLLDLIDWESKNKYSQDVTISELAEIAEAYYGYSATIIENPSIEDIEGQIAEGNPVIVPAAGRMLGNPYFSGEGPWYHMLIITGYTSRYFITNDPGTRRGEDYKYKHNVLMESIHDWTGIKEEIQKGRKVVLVLSQ